MKSRILTALPSSKILRRRLSAGISIAKSCDTSAFEKFNRIKDKVGEIHRTASSLSFTTQTRELEEIVRLSDEILEEL